MKNGELKIANDRLTHTINKNKDRGITLVALVITIIILLILATISIQSLTNTGLFKNAQKAKDETQNAAENQAKTLNEYEDELNKYISGTPTTPPVAQVKKVADNVGTVLSATDNTELQDAYGNKIVVPAGFKITNDATTVDKGIVIEDATSTATAGSQFVWVPVGKIYTDTDKTEANAKTIELNRYTFDTNGNPTAQNENVIETYYQELETSNKGNTVAKDINAFKTSATTNGGYYIGRYEARQRNEKITVTKNDTVWYNITQPNAATQARNMYQNATKFTSDLMNSYAWDTATLFLQTCGTNSKYSRQNSLNTSLSTTGTTNDIQCNVYDMASNVREWTTETSFRTSNDTCVLRGGNYFYSDNYTSYRDYYATSFSIDLNGFRPLLYVGLNS